RGGKTLLFPLIKEIFGGPYRDSILNAIAAMINNNACEYNAQGIAIETDSDKMRTIICPAIEERLKSNFPRLDYFARTGRHVEISSSSPKRSPQDGTEDAPRWISPLTEAERKGSFLGIDVGATRIKAVLVKNGITVNTGMVDTTFDGGRALGLAIRDLARQVTGGDAVTGIGLSLPGVVDSVADKPLWLINYEKGWKGKHLSAVSEYAALLQEIEFLKKERSCPSVNMLNDGTAFGIAGLNGGIREDAVLVVIGTGVGAARIEDGLVDIARIEQAGAFAFDARTDAAVSESCRVKGCFADLLRDSNGDLMPPRVFAKKLVALFNLMHRIRQDAHFILTGGAIAGEYGAELLSEIKYLMGMSPLRVELSADDVTYSGALGAAQFAMKQSQENMLDTIHAVSMSLVKPAESGEKHTYLILKEMIPLDVRSEFEALLKTIYRQYPFIKESEEIRLVEKDSIASVIESINKDTSRKNIITAALNSTEGIAELPPGVRAVVFESEGRPVDIRWLEGILAVLRAVSRGDTDALLRLYEIMTGAAAPSGAISPDTLRDMLADPQKLSKVLKFILKPAVPITDEIRVKNIVLKYIRESA
ncbi:MAG: hypothetical protein PHS37_09880, partial [Candidatus Omnitrophica bacterium]|nr:hypothetical protein [Candidatus Omnitrophota bacterium]